MRFLSIYFFCILWILYPIYQLPAQDYQDSEYDEEYDQDDARRDNYYVITDDDFFNYNNKEQNRAFLDHEDPFPAKPKDEWEVSAKLGGLGLSGLTPRADKIFLGFMGGLAVRKAIGYVVSLRGEYQYKSSNATELAFTQHGLFVDAVFSLNNVNFHKQELLHNIYTFVGPGIGFSHHRFTGFGLPGGAEQEFETDNTDYMISAGFGFSYKLNKLSVGAELRYAYAMNLYRLDNLNQEAITNNYLTLSAHVNVPIGGSSRVESLWWLNPLTYPYSELNIPRHQKTFKVRFKDEDEDGIADQFDKEPNTRNGCPVNALGITLDTDKDGVPDCDDLEPITPTRCQPVNEDGIGKCPVPQFNNVDVSPNFQLDSIFPGFPDLDKDGVPDIYDREPNTKEGCPVDAKGELLDTDRDGVPDCYDLEVITPTYCLPVDTNGVGNCFPSNCCEGLMFKDSTKHDTYLEKLREKERQIDSLNQLLNKGVEHLREKLRDNNQVSIETKDGRVRISLNNSILFESGSTAIKKSVMPILEEVAIIIKENPGFDVMIGGHTDNVPIRNERFKDNWELSSGRALSVVRILTEQLGVDPKYLSSVGHGEFVPIGDNNTEEGRARNRRIEITLFPQK